MLWAETLAAKLDALTWTVERGERINAATFSKRARERNGLRAVPGTSPVWRLAAHGDPVLVAAVETEYGTTFSTRKAAEAAIPNATVWLRNLYSNRLAYSDDLANMEV